MTPKTYLLFLSLLLGSLFSHAADRPNIILMMADDQGWGDTGYNGHPHLKTPHLDKMSKEGITFTRFYSANAMCSPTRASVYTGRHPYRTGITFAMKGMLEPEEITLTKVLKQEGYTTGHFGKWHMGTLSPKKPDQNRWGAFMEDPERYYCPPWERDVDVSFVTESKVPTWDPMKHPGGIKENASDEENALKGSKYGNEYFTGPGEVATVNVDGDDSRVLMDRAIPFIENAVESDTPFLAVIWFHTPHSPVVAGSKYKEMYSEYSDNEQHYYGCITAMDEQIGRLRSKLEELDVADDTMVWYCSDNGAARQGSPRHVGSVGGLTGFKLSLQEGGIRVPGLLVWPAKCPKRQTVTTPCVTTDYFPTILAALDIPLPDDRPYDGMSIWPLIEEPNWTRTKPIGFLHNGKVWMDYKYKLISKKEEEFRLYDIIADPAEKHDLAEKLPNVFRRMKAEFEPWHQSVLADLERVESR
jgi:arylsulfatase A-like enzyme